MRTLPPSLYDAGRPFHFATVVDDPAQLAAVERGLAAGLGRRSGFVAHLALDTAVQRAPAAQTAACCRCRIRVSRGNATARADRGLRRCSA